ncbi:MAG: DinB family protein [Chloroflexi bacterium]|nr:DinB family protein [Chloroflexota bacterium]
MNKKDIQLLFQYNQWANRRILNAAENLTQDQFLAQASFPHGGLRGTLTHALFAEWIWRTRWQGDSPVNRMKAEDFPTFSLLRERWSQEEKALSAFVEGLDDKRLTSTFSYHTTRGEKMEEVLWHAMVHVVNHGTQHRSEAAAMLTDFGCSPGDIDMIIYLREAK